MNQEQKEYEEALRWGAAFGPGLPPGRPRTDPYRAKVHGFNLRTDVVTFLHGFELLMRIQGRTGASMSLLINRLVRSLPEFQEWAKGEGPIAKLAPVPAPELGRE